MKNSEEIAKKVFEERDTHAARRMSRNRRIRKNAVFCAAVCTFCMAVVGVGYFQSMQRNLLTAPMDAKNEKTEAFQKCPPEENETAVQMTSMHSEIPETPILTLPVQSVQTETVTTQASTETVSSSADMFVSEPTEAPLIQTEVTLPETAPTEEFIEVPQWDEKTISEKFLEFTANDAVFVSKCSSISSEYVGEKLYDATVMGYDDYADEVRYADASVHRISSISENCAVAVRFRGYDTGYVYTNRNYFPETLGELMDAVNLMETISFHTFYPAQDGSITEYEHSLLLDLLNEHRELVRLEDDSFHKPLFSVSTSVELLGIRNKSLKITEDGYLTTNIMEWGYVFYIGEEAAAEIARAFGIEAADTPITTDTDAAVQTTPANEVMTGEMAIES